MIDQDWILHVGVAQKLHEFSLLLLKQKAGIM